MILSSGFAVALVAPMVSYIEPTSNMYGITNLEIEENSFKSTGTNSSFSMVHVHYIS